MNEEIILNVEQGQPYVVGARAYVEQTEDGAVITIIDKDGTTTATVNNGADGVGISSVTLNGDYTLTINYSDGTSVTTTSIRGETGASGVYCGTEEPLDPAIEVWVDPSGGDAEDGSVLRLREDDDWKPIPSIVGEAAGFGTVTATVDTNVGTPTVVVTSSGEDTAKNFAFQFKNLGYDDSDLQDDFADLASDFGVLQGQFDTAVAAVTTDTEVTDIRVGADGVTDTTAGASVRRQFNNVKSALSYAGIGNAFDGALSNSYWNSSGAIVAYSGDVCNTNKIPCNGGDTIRIITDPVVADAALYVSYFDSVGTTRVRRDTGTGTLYEGIAPDGASYVCFTFEKAGLTKNNFNSVKVFVNHKIDSLENEVAENESEANAYYYGVNENITPSSSGYYEVSSKLLKGVPYCLINNCNKSIALRLTQLNGATELVIGEAVSGAGKQFVINQDYKKLEVYVSATATGTVTIMDCNLNDDYDDGVVGGQIEKLSNGYYRLKDSLIIQGSYNSSGATTASTTVIRHIGFIKVRKGEQIHFVPGENAKQMLYGTFDTNKVYISDSSWYSAEANINIDADGYVICVFKRGDGTDLAPSSYDATLDIATKTEKRIASIESEISGIATSSIIKRNADILLNVNAASYYGHNGEGVANKNKQFSMLVTTDVHSDSTRFASAIDYLNGTASIDAGICLGDITAENFINPKQWYIDNVNRSTKPFYTVLGNHDGGNSTLDSVSGTVEEQFDAFIEPTLSKIGIADLTTPYYMVSYADYGVSLICLDCFDVPDTKDGSGNFVVSRGTPAYSQDQIDWFITALNSVPVGYHLVVAAHYIFDGLTPIECVFTKANAHDLTGESGAYNYKGMIPEIVNAWINGSSLSKTYTPNNANLPTITVSANFSVRGEGIFASYLTGHTHWDTMYKVTAFPDQHVVNLDTTANDLWQTNWSDLPRALGTKAEDCITAFVVDTSTNTVRLVRIGANITDAMTERTMYKFSY